MSLLIVIIFFLILYIIIDKSGDKCVRRFGIKLWSDDLDEKRNEIIKYFRKCEDAENYEDFLQACRSLEIEQKYLANRMGKLFILRYKKMDKYDFYWKAYPEFKHFKK